MTDRQDIDALLISALYGELTPADEARLTAHLDSHPGDRGALDDLKSARAKVLESRIFELQAEPPQHISALLLQEAHRRAPKMVVAQDGEKQSWFWRFARSFMLHPAMAAAAMLVIVLGVGAIMYKNKGADFAHREVSAPAQNEPTVAFESQSNGAAAGSAAMPDPSYRADLAEEKDLKAADQGAAEGAAQKETASDSWRADGKDGDLRKAQAPARDKNSITVTTEQPQPKDLESDRAEQRQAAQHGAQNAEKAKVATKGALSKDDSAGFDLDGTADNLGGQGTATGAGRAPGAGGGGTANGVVAGGFAAPTAPPATTVPQTGTAYGPTGSTAGNRGYAQPPPPPSAAANDKTTTATTTAPAPAPKQAPAKVAATPTAKPDAKPPTTTKAPAKNESVAKAGASKAPASDAKKVAAQPAPVAQSPSTPAADSTLVAWAKSQHARAVALAKDGKCQSAAQVALGVSQKAPDYYASFMASDRQLKSCKQYIDNARDAEAEKSAKSRAQKRVNADEAAPADSSLNK